MTCWALLSVRKNYLNGCGNRLTCEHVLLTWLYSRHLGSQFVL
uniref:Uncharacterized protein n=1 Tax=Arundo donax TaxID=35708 RepID=A0A0A8YE40_ARUDO